MSHFTVIKTKIIDADILLKVLAELGFKKVKVYGKARHLFGYMGDVRPQTAEIIIRRWHIGLFSNDIGFKRNPDGAFDAIISQFDSARFNTKWLEHLCQRYAYYIATEKLLSQGFEIVEENTSRDKAIHITLRRIA
jgi:hypothetical protein